MITLWPKASPMANVEGPRKIGKLELVSKIGISI
jgi:hypothetical protein